MAWLEKIAKKLKISVTTLVIILSTLAVILITSIVLGFLFQEELRYRAQIGKVKEGDAVNVRYIFDDLKTASLPVDFMILPKDVYSTSTDLLCMGEEQNCQVSLFYQTDGKPLSLMAMVANDETGYPLNLSAVSLQFTGYEPYTDINIALPDETDQENYSFIDRLELVRGGDVIAFPEAKEWLEQQTNPMKTTGKFFYLNLGEEFAENAELLSMGASEMEFLSIALPFNANTLPGWYAFAISLQYETPEGNRYRTPLQTMNVIIPDTIHFYQQRQENDTEVVGEQAFFKYHSLSHQVLAQDVTVSPISEFTMIIETGVDENLNGFPNTFWKYDLHTGNAEQVFPSSTWGEEYLSNNGWKQVLLTPNYDWALYDFSTDTTVLLEDTDNFITPSWSPNDNKLSFFHEDEDNVIGIYDIKTGQMQKINLTLNGTLKDMHWMSNASLALMVQNGGVTSYYRYHPEGSLLELIHGIAGVDEDEFVITSQGRIVATNGAYGITIPDLKYISPLEYGSAGLSGWYCDWLEDEFIAFCSTGGKVYLVDQVNETTVKILETSGLAGIERFGTHGLAIITNDDVVHFFDVRGEEKGSLHIEGISGQFAFGLRFTFLEGR